jgi:hypothetical protein
MRHSKFCGLTSALVMFGMAVPGVARAQESRDFGGLGDMLSDFYNGRPETQAAMAEGAQRVAQKTAPKAQAKTLQLDLDEEALELDESLVNEAPKPKEGPVGFSKQGVNLSIGGGYGLETRYNRALPNHWVGKVQADIPAVNVKLPWGFSLDTGLMVGITQPGPVKAHDEYTGEAFMFHPGWRVMGGAWVEMPFYNMDMDWAGLSKDVEFALRGEASIDLNLGPRDAMYNLDGSKRCYAHGCDIEISDGQQAGIGLVTRYGDWKAALMWEVTEERDVYSKAFKADEHVRRETTFRLGRDLNWGLGE